MKYLPILIILPLLGGCLSSEKATLRDSMYDSVRTERQFAKDTAANLTVDSTTGKDHRDRLQSLTTQQSDQLFKADQEFENLYQKDKLNDHN